MQKPGLPHTTQPDMNIPETSARRLPAGLLIGISLFLGAFALYLATMNWAPAPGLPTQALLAQLGLASTPAALDFLWGGMVRLFARLPGLSIAGWAGMFSALCGAACVSLLALLMMRVGFQIETNPAQSQIARETQARRLSGLVSGLYLAVCMPFWMFSTRSLPGAFHLLLLLLAAWVFSAYQRGGRLWQLGLLGVLYGVGITEFTTFVIFSPLALVLVAREIYRWQALRDWRAYLVLVVGVGVGLALYPVHAYVLFKQGIPAGLFASPWQAWAQILQDQALLITQAPFRNSVFLLVLFVPVAMWLMVFAMSHRSPWFYEIDQIVVRVVFIGILLFVLGVVRYAWGRLGLSNLMMTPHVLLAACMGYLAGEFWILGEVQPLGDDSLAKRSARHAASAVALLLPLGVLAGGMQNWRVVDGRSSRIVQTAALEVLERLAGRDVVFSTGLLDDALNLAVWERQANIHLVSVALSGSTPYLRRLANGFAEEALRTPLLRGEFGLFVENLLLSDDGPARTAIIEIPEMFREFGFVVPDGYVFRLEAAADRVDLPALVASQRAFWTRMERMATHPVPEGNLIRPYQDMLRLLVSKVANNLGIMQLERGDESGALETFRAARRIAPENLSVLLNLLDAIRDRALPEAQEWQAEWDLRQDQLAGEQWALAIRYGYLWNAAGWVQKGWVWALTGAPAGGEAARRAGVAEDESVTDHARLIDQIFLQWGAPMRNESYFHALLMKNGKDLPALQELCRLALRRNDPEAAEAYLAEAERLGLAPPEVQFIQAIATLTRGDRNQAVAALEELTRKTPADARIWMALLWLTDAGDPLNANARKALKGLSAPPIGVRLALAWFHLLRREWSAAQTELNLAMQVDSNNRLAWEMMATLAEITGNRKLRSASLGSVLARDSQHPFGVIQRAFDQYQRGDLAGMEATLRAGLLRRRHPELLHVLANLLIERQGDLQEARALVDEALRAQPFNPIFRITRSELYLRDGNLAAMEEDLRQVLEDQPDSLPARLGLAQMYAVRGDLQAACRLAQELVAKRSNLLPEQQARLDILLEQCASHE